MGPLNQSQNCNDFPEIDECFSVNLSVKICFYYLIN